MLAISVRSGCVSQGLYSSCAYHKKSKRPENNSPVDQNGDTSLFDQPANSCTQLQPYKNLSKEEKEAQLRVKMYELYMKAKSGDTEAKYKLAWSFAKRNAFKSDKIQAWKWLRRAADEGHPDALYAQGKIEMFSNGGIECPKGICRMVLAANKKNAKAEMMLGWCYETGYGMKQNPAKSLEHYQRAHDLGFDHAENAACELTDKNFSRE